MKDIRSSVEPVVRHARVVQLGQDAYEQGRVEAFAWDLASWLAGAPRTELQALARVIVVVGGRTLRDTRVLCSGLPLLAIESAARATEELWPMLRELTRRTEEPTKDEDEGGETSPEGAGGGAGESDEAGEADEGSGQGPGAAIEMLADGDTEDDEMLEALVDQLADAEDPVQDLADHFEHVGEPAWQGAKEAEELVRTLEQLAPGIGWGAAPGHLHATLARHLDRLAELLSSLSSLRALARQLGRLEADTRSIPGQQGGSEEVTGVRVGGDVALALPSEWALLGDPDTEDLFYLRLAEHRLVSLELAGDGVDGVSFDRSRGPVILCIDTSGSMQGPPEEGAKALVLAVAREVLPQGRAVHVVLFGAPGERTEFRLRRGAGGLEDLLAFLVRGFSGGTDFDTPLVRAMELIRERDFARADVVVVTDGYAYASREVTETVAATRRDRGLRIWSVLIGPGSSRGVDAFSDEVWRIDPVQESPSQLLRRVSRPR